MNSNRTPQDSATASKRRLVAAAVLATLLITIHAAPAKGQVPASDSLALVALYNSTNGPAWTDNTGWLTGPVSTWFGVSVADGRVQVLSFSFNNLTGPIPAELADLDRVFSIRMTGNALSGTIPVELGNMTRVTILWLNDNQLSGPIPPALAALSNLFQLHLARNNLSGSIPPELGSLSNLTFLALGNNELTGTIPAALSGLTKLQEFSLNNNQLSGSIPPELGAMTDVSRIIFTVNLLTGPLPVELASLVNMHLLDVSQNQLSGPVPAWLGDLPLLTWLNISDNLFAGNLPAELGNRTEMFHLRVNDNPLAGTIPASFENLTLMTTFNYRDTGLCASADPGFQAWLATIANLFTSGCTSVANEAATETPHTFALHGNYPNPFNPSTTIRYTLPEAAAVSIRIFDLSGAVVQTISRPIEAAGEHAVPFQAPALPSGVYFYRLQAGNHTATGKMVLLK